MIKKSLLLFAIFTILSVRGQTSQYDLAVSLIKRVDKSANLENKMILISFWTINDADSRERNKEMERVSKIYEKAKLKGGSAGVYFYNFCIDEDQLKYKISLKRDSINSSSSYIENKEEFNIINSTFELNTQPNVFIFDSKGNMISKGFAKKDVFTQLLNQITR
ncbi:MAG: hypothetical protein ACK5QC_02475 [Bacteroidota bacterium]|jgi:hypothetical protein